MIPPDQPRPQAFLRRHWPRFLRIVAIVASWLACRSTVLAEPESPPRSARFVQEVPGGGDGLLVKCDLQHRFFDDSQSVGRFVLQAVENQCQAVFVAPSEPTKSAETLSAFLRDVELARQLFPKVTIIPVYSWFIRSGGQADRALIILPPSDDFATRFVALSQQLNSTLPPSEAMEGMLKTLFPESMTPEQWPAVLFNQRQEGLTLHQWMVQQQSPSRLWSGDAELSPSQRALGQIGLLDRWDPYALRCGNDWDQLLADGWNGWAAAEGVDFDFPDVRRIAPGAFTETWLHVPQLTHDDVVQAVKHGAFFGVRGRAAEDVQLTVSVPGLTRPATAGETIDVPVGTRVRVRLTLTVPELDWRKTPNHLDGVELIAVTPEHSRIVHKEATSRGRVALDYETLVPEGGVLFRALGYRDVEDSPNYGFFTNPIRIVASGQWVRPAIEIPPEPWVEDGSGVLTACVLLVFSLSAVGGWLIYTGKFRLLFGKYYAPIVRLWSSSTIGRWLTWKMRHHADRRGNRHSLGTTLSPRQRHGLVAVLVTGTAVLGAVCGSLVDSSWIAWPAISTSLGARMAIGAALGAMCGWFMRWHSLFGISIFLSLKLAAGLWPDMIPASAATACLSAAVMGFAVQGALRSGTLRWPSNSPIGTLFAGSVCFIAASAAQGFAPGVFGSLIWLCAILAAAIWYLRNEAGHPDSFKMLAVGLTALFWIGVALADRNRTGASASAAALLRLLAEALGIGLLCIAARPERLDLLGIVLTAAAVAAVGMLAGSDDSQLEMLWTAGAAALGVLVLFAADAPWFATAALGMAALVLGRVLLFAPSLPGSWLIGAAAAAAGCMAAKHRLRMALFLLPYVIVGGYCSWRFANSQAAPIDFWPPGWDALFRHEWAALQMPTGRPANFLQTIGPFLALFSLTGLSILFLSIRERSVDALFDAVGRLIVAALIVVGMLVALGTPLHGPAGVALAAAIGLWASQARRPDANQLFAWRAAAAADRNLARLRRNLAISALIVAGLIAYGSLVPFHWREIPWRIAEEEFLAQIRDGLSHPETFWRRINSDRIVNVAIAVPLGFLVSGSLVLGRRNLLARAASVLEAWQMSLVVSILIEFAQQWSNGRVAAVHDVMSQALGAAIGIILWLVVGERFTLGLVAAWEDRTTEVRWAQLLLPYLLGVLLFAVLPAGLPVTSPIGLYGHYRDGRIALMPFADCADWRDVLRDAVAGVVLFIPIGMWGALAFRRPGEPLRSVFASAANGTAFAALITVLRCLCSVKFTDSSWLLTGAIGSALGAAGLHLLLQSDFGFYANWKRSLIWWAASLAFGVVLAGFFLHPWRFDAPPEVAAAHWATFVNTPFAAFHTGNDWQLIEEVVRKLAWFGGWGVLLGHAVCCTTDRRLGRFLGSILALALAAGVGLGIELAQLWQTNHSGEITDVITDTCGAFIGIWLRLVWLNPSPYDGRSTYYRRTDFVRSSAAPRGWTSLIQTTLAISLAAGLLLGVLVLFLRR